MEELSELNEMILSQGRERVTQKVFLYESAPPNK